MTPLEIKIELMKAGVSGRSIARKLEVSCGAVWLVINRGMVSSRIMDAIADAIGKKPTEVFSSYPENPRGRVGRTRCA